MRKTVTDPRFRRVHTDPRFKRQSKVQKKVKIDNRFKGMFDDPDFAGIGARAGAHDKYGRRQTSTETGVNRENDLKRFYDIEAEDTGKEDRSMDDNEEDLESKLDRLNRLARGEEGSDSSSSSDDESDTEEAHGARTKSRDNIVKPEYGSGESSCRLAVVNMDWDKMRAEDLFVLFSSFAPSSGFVASVTVYPSLFGMKEMKKETLSGPSMSAATMMKDANDESDVDEEEADEETRIELIRKYEKRRMMYYFAVVECDSIKTAESIFRACEAAEFEHSSNMLEISYVPDALKIEQEPRDSATSMPGDPNYAPPDFVTTAMQQTKNVECSWDRNDYQRLKTFSSWQPAVDALKDNDFSAYLAPCSDEEDETRGDGASTRAKNLLSLALGVGNDDEEDDEEDASTEVKEITFVPNVAKKIQRNIEERKRAENETVFEKYQRERKAKRRERRKQKKIASDGLVTNTNKDPMPSVADEEDPFAAWDRGAYDGTEENDRSEAKEDRVDDDNEEERRLIETELLLLGSNSVERDEDDASRGRGRRSKRKKGHSKKKEKASKSSVADLNDKRFTDLFSNPEFAIDRTNKRYKKTATSEAIIRKRLSESSRKKRAHSDFPDPDEKRTKKKKRKKRGKKKRKKNEGAL
eukprot:g676.t1